MASCRLTDVYRQKIDEQISNIVAEVDLGEKSTSVAKLEIQKVLESLNEVTPKKDVIQMVIDIAKMNGIYGDASIFYATDAEVESIIQDGGKLTTTIDNQNSTEILEEAARNRRARDVKKDFLVQAYGTATIVRDKVEQEAAVELANAVLINRDSTLDHGLPVTTANEINQNLRNYQLKLFDTILEYLQLKEGEQTVLPLYQSDGQGGWNYTNAIHDLETKINQYLKRDRFPDLELLRLLESTDPNDQLRLKAYNAWQLLSHFDSLVAVRYGKALTNDEFGDMSFSGKNKWHRPDKGANNKTTWRTTDEIRLTDEIDKAIQELVNTTPLYEYNGNVPISYMKFDNFSNVLAVIKDLVYNLGDYEFDDTDLGFSSETKQAVQGKTFKLLVNLIRYNPQKYLGVVFEVLSKGFDHIKSKSPSLLLGINQSERNIIYSVHKGLTGSDETHAVNAISKLDSKSVIYEQLAQAADSIYRINFLQYYTNLKGTTTIRNMQSTQLDRIIRDIRHAVKTKNTRLIPSLFESKAEIFKPLNDANGTYQGVEIKLYDDIIAYVATDGRVTYSKNGKNANILLNDKALDYINLGLGLNINRSIINKMPGKSMADSLKSLLDFSSRVLANSYISNVLLKDKLTKTDILETLNSIFGADKAPKIDTTFREMDILHEKDVNTIEALAYATALEQGLYSSQVKSGTGNSQSQQSLSRLLGSYQSQYELLNKNIGSATKDSLILKDGILRGVYTAKEYYDLHTSKDHTDFNVKEFATSMFMQDFICGMMHNTSYNPLVGDGVIALIPSVNSDKNTIGRLIIDTNQKVELGGTSIRIKDMNTLLLQSLISKELGTIYNNVVDKINSDFITVLAGTKYNLVYTEESFDNFNRQHIIYDSNGQPTGKFDSVRALNELIKTYNLNHRNAPISITDLMHFIANKDGSIKPNETLLNYILEFNKRGEVTPIFANFMLNKSADILGSLLRSGFKVDLTIENDVNNYILNNLDKSWVDSSTGEMILGKFTFSDGNVFTIRNTNDLNKLLNILKESNLLYNSQILADLSRKGMGLLQLNPLIEKYNYLDYLFTLEFMISTVGTLAAHPVKKSDGIREHDEAARYQAQHKRNVSYTATMLEFALNLVTGIPTDYNIAVVDDIKDILYNVSGDIDDGIKPFDGATIVNPFIVYLENNSLGGAKAGITKKQFVHFYDENTANGGIIKTCGFGITNDWMRNSTLMLNIMRKMTSGTWFDTKGQYIHLNILLNFRGENVQLQPIYFRKNGNYYRIDNIDSKGLNKYDLTITLLDIDKRDGQLEAEYLGDLGIANTSSIFETDENGLVTVDSNYKLWQLFGGKDSLDLDGTTLKPSNASVENVVTVMNSVGVDPTTNSQTILNNVQTLEDVYQPLKHSDIHYIATAGAVKQGAANINTNSAYNDDIPLNFMKIHMYQAGILLDKEHHADGAELSLMTLVINACAHAGYSMDDSMEMFKALRTLTDVGISDLLKPLQKYIQNTDGANTENLRLAVVTATVNTVLKVLSKLNFNEGDMLQVFCKDLLEQIKNGKVLKYTDFIDKLPIDNPAVYAKFVSTASVFLTNSGIKMKIPGILSVLTPSYNIMKIFTLPVVVDGVVTGYKEVKWEQIESNLQGLSPQEYLESLQQYMPKIFTAGMTDFNELKIGKTFRISTTNAITGETRTFTKKLLTPPQFKAWKEDIKNGLFEGEVLNSMEVDISAGRELGNYNAYFQGIENGSEIKENYQIWDFDSIQALYELQSIFLEKDILKKLTALNDFASKYQYLLQGSTDVEKTIRERVRHDLATISDNGSDFYLDNIIYINGKQVNPILSSVQHEAYEIVLPKLFVNEFGLKPNDLLNEVKDDTNFFTNRLINNINTNLADADNYDIVLLNQSGQHYHLVESIVGTEGLTEVPIHKFVDDSGKILRVDEDGNENYYELSSDKDKVYVDSQGHEIIVTDNLQFYIDNLSYSTAHISSQHDLEGIEEFIQIFKNSSNHSARKFYHFLTDNLPETINYLNGDNQAEAVEIAARERALEILNRAAEIGTDRHNAYLSELGMEMHTSFLKYLEVVASRTPSQSMLSFMPMKIVAFDNPNINTAYVSTAQIWLLGSDYDVDAVSVATYQIDKSGRLPLWSPYARLSDLKSLNDSMRIAFPTGKKVNIINYDASKVLKSLDLFYKYMSLFDIVRTKDSFHLRLAENYDINQLKEFIDEINSLPELCKLNEFQNNNIMQQVLHAPAGDFDFVEAMCKLVDTHNLYFNKMNSGKLLNIAKNYSMYKMYKVIDTPMNLQQALSSVDAMTGPLKDVANASETGNLIKTRTPGNVFDKAESIEDNLVGKEGIGICAVGMKTFFGLTAYYNNILNNKEDLSHLRLDTNGIDLYIPRLGLTQTFNYFANINPKLKSQLYTSLSQVKTDTDAALVLSALLSLATDNAKELALSKLNAGTKTIGMYIYGISIGMNFTDIADIMMSPLATLITDLTKGNIFTGESGIFSIDKVFDYLEGGPRDLIRNYDDNLDIAGLSEKGKALTDTLALLLANNAYEKDLDPSDMFLKFAWSSNTTLKEKLQILEGYKNKTNYYSKVYGLQLLLDGEHTIPFSKAHQQQFNQLVEIVENYVRHVDLVRSNIGLYNSIKTLAEGGSEFRIMGQIFGLNQGLKTKPEELLSKVFDIQNIVYERLKTLAHNNDRTKKLNALLRESRVPKATEYGIKPERFSISLIAFDENARTLWILKYDSVKHTVNIIDAMFSVPHFAGYVQTLATAYSDLLTTSKKFKLMRDVGIQKIDELEITSSKDKAYLFKGIGNYYSDYVRKCWMLEKLDPISITKGTAVIKNGKINKSSTMIKLGTEDGDASFKYLMENKIIPNLLKGKLGGNFVIHRLKDNKFISDLSTQLLTSTVSKNPIIYYTLPINMMPSTDLERSVFNSYKSAFNKLSEFSYNLNGVNYPLHDLFYYYGLIAHYGKQGPQSIMPLFESLHQQGKLKDFHNYEATFDKVLPKNLGLGIYPYIMSLESPYTAHHKYIYAMDEANMRVELYLKLQREYGESKAEFKARQKDEGAVRGYVKIRNASLIKEEVQNYMMSQQRQFNYTEQLITTPSGNAVTIQNIDNNIVVKYDNKKLSLSSKTMPRKVVNMEVVDDLDTLYEEIDLSISELNKEC